MLLPPIRHTCQGRNRIDSRCVFPWCTRLLACLHNSSRNTLSTSTVRSGVVTTYRFEEGQESLTPPTCPKLLSKPHVGMRGSPCSPPPPGTMWWTPPRSSPRKWAASRRTFRRRVGCDRRLPCPSTLTTLHCGRAGRMLQLRPERIVALGSRSVTV